MTRPEKMKLLFRLTLLVAVLTSEVCTQQSTSSDFIVSSCRRSLMQLDLPAQNVLKKYVRFSAIDQTGVAHVITDAVATQCGYTIAYDDWGSITFMASLYSCYTNIRNDSYYTVTVKTEISATQNMVAAASYMKVVNCSYVWSPREIICANNYMEVSVRRKIPLIAEGIFKDEPEDWSTAFNQAVSGFMSVWQVVFHLSTTQKSTMLIDEAQGIGYGINTTEARILLRSPYSPLQAVPQKIGGVTFSTLKTTLFYKQRWFIYLVDNAVACPVDDVQFVGGSIVWTVPKNIYPLLTGSKSIQNSRIQFGIDLLNLTKDEIVSRNYVIVDSSTATTSQIPVGAVGGTYKSRVSNFQYGITYHIRPFLENVWIDNAWGVTKYTIIKDITTPFQPRPPVLTNETVPLSQIFNVTVGTFLPDVRLVNLTVGVTTFTVPQAVDHGYVVENRTNPNGSVVFVAKVPIGDENVYTETVPDGIRFVLNITFGFKIIPYDETFTTTGIIEYFIRQPNVGPCQLNGGTLTASLGNLDPSWSVYVTNTLATSSSGLLASANGTQSTIQVPAASNLVKAEVTLGGLTATIPISIRDQNGNILHSILVSCDAPPNPPVCLPDGTIQVAVQQISNIPNMDMSKLTLRNSSCGPVAFDKSTAKFSFTVNSCQTTRTFLGNLMIYNNEIFYDSPITGNPLYIMNVTCNYTTNSTLVVKYGYMDNPTPSARTGIAPIDLVLRLSVDDGYNVFYNDLDYPVVKWLREALYFEVELLYSTDPQLELFLETCWATATPDMNSQPSWPIIDNSCEFNEPYLTVFLPVTANARVQFPSHLKRFEVKTFTFMNGSLPYEGEIYFHCDAIICDSSNLASDPTCTQMGSCIPARQRMGRSVDADDKHRLVSSRAVFLLASKMRADSKQSQNHPQ